MNTHTDTHDCDHRRIDAFLDSDAVGPEDNGLVDHLSHCDTCRVYLESRSGDKDTWTHAAELLRPTSYDNASTAEFTAAFHGSLRIEQTALIQQVIESLAPTDDPHKLGRIGEYEVSGVVGAGGMGVVLKAVDPALDRVVAIKVMAPHLASSAAARKRFEREAKAAAAVLHPNVIPIHSVCGTDPVPYLVMAYIRGGSLQSRMDHEGPLPTIDILRIGAQIAAGLAAAHEQGLVHRDIKPENILLEKGIERVTLTDFGLARAVDDASVTQPGTIAGTPRYMSPEQARGESIDQQSDLFSLGSVLYTMCTGRPPFRGDTSYGVMRRISDEAPTPIRDINPEIPDWLSHVVEKLMAKNKADRFATADEVRKLLEACLSHTQQPTHSDLPASLRLRQGPTKARRGIARFFNTKLGVFTMIAVLAAAAVFLAIPPNASSEPTALNQPTEAQRQAEAAAKDGKFGAGDRAPEPPAAEAIDKKTTQFLEEAVKNGDLLAVGAALKAGVDPNGVRGQLSPLAWAVSDRITSKGETAKPSIEIARALLFAGADVNAKNYMGVTALESAATYASPEIVELLIKAGANVNAESSYGTPLLAASSVEVARQLIDAGADPNIGKVIKPLSNAAKHGKVEWVQMLIKAGARIDDPKDPPILWARTPEVLTALIAAGARPDQRNANGDTILHLPYGGSFPPDVQTVKLVLAEGVDVNAKNKDGSTPLHAAILFCAPEIAGEYISAGAVVDVKDKKGNTPLSLAHARIAWARANPAIDEKPYQVALDVLLKAGAKDDGRTDLQRAVAAGDLAKVKALIAAKAELNAFGPQKTTAVHLASESGNDQILKLLIEAGAAADLPNAFGLRPLHLAANAKTAQALIAAGAEIKSAVKSPIPMASPLYMAIVKGKADVVQTLLERADFEDEAKAGMLNWAVFAGHVDVVKTLLADKHAKAFLHPKQAFLPLHVAASGTVGIDASHQTASAADRLAIAKLLVESGSEVDVGWGTNFEVDPKSVVAGMVGTTPLMFAAGKGELKMVNYLLDQGADPKASNKAGQTALHFAAEHGHLAVVERLVEKKVIVNALTKSGQTPLDIATNAEVQVFLIQNGGKKSSDPGRPD